MNRPAAFGPDHPHPLSTMKTELVWEGKYDAYGNRRPIKLPASPLPLQRIETIDEPRDRSRSQGLLWEPESAHRDDFRNLLIWGDNKLALAALLEQFRGKIDLIYIDPPFDVGADFTMQVQLGGEGEALQKEQSILEAVAYRDTWGKGTDSFIHMINERFILMRELLKDNGIIYVHMGWGISHYIKLILDEIFGSHNFINQIIWKRQTAHSDIGQGSKHLGRIHDIIFLYSKGNNFTWNMQYQPYSNEYIKTFYKYVEPETGRRYRLSDLTAPGGAAKGNPYYEFLGITRFWRFKKEKMEELYQRGRIVQIKPGTVPSQKRYLDEMPGVPVQDLWFDINPVQPQSFERVGYNTQKPEGLIERILKLCTLDEDLVADFFCGSGTTMAVAEKLGRRWIGVDLGRYAIHVSRKRLIQVQRELHTAGKPYRSFDVYNLGRYERQWWQLDRLKGADSEHRRLVLQFYQAAPLDNPPHPLLHGKKHGAFVHVDQIDSIFAFDELKAAAEAARSAGGRELHCLAWEFEMELAAKKQAIEAETGLTVRLKYIPREIMEPNRTACQFFEAGYLEARAIKKGKKVDVELLRFTPALAEAPEAEMSALRERAIKSPFDFIDFWAVDFDWRDNKPFEHHWQDFRTRKDRSLKTRTDLGWEYDHQGPHRVCIKVIDVFGVDTTTIIAA
ncbi:MAG TPA: site-specific DNA-methyltransferase [Desulfobacterales bacterium]|nr:site-specific DNA-methyltransferase [Desulfobacterales bacterium]